jgi:hypothetical protein
MVPMSQLAAIASMPISGRAQSPAAAPALAISQAMTAFAHMAPEGADASNLKQAAALARRMPLMASTSLSELLLCVPFADYRDVLRRYLDEGMRARKSHLSLVKQVAELERMYNAEEVHPSLKQKPPQVQFTKEFLALKRPETSNLFKDAFAAYQRSMMQQWLAEKTVERNLAFERTVLTLPSSEVMMREADEDEAAYVLRKQKSVVWSAVGTSLKGDLDRVYHRLAENSFSIIWEPANAQSNGLPVFGGRKPDSAVSATYSLLLEDLEVIWNKAQSLVVDVALALEVKVEKKKKLQEASMKDVEEASSSKSVSEMVRAEVAKALQQGNARGKKVRDLRYHVFEDFFTFTNAQSLVPLFPLGDEGSRPTRERRELSWGQLWRSSRTLDQSGGASGSSTRTRDAGWQRGSSVSSRPFETSPGFDGERQGIIMDDNGTLALRVASAPFRYDDAHTYPDWLLTVSLRHAQQFIWARMPSVVLESMRYRSSIHMIDCDVPREIAMHLSAGLKYMLPTKYSPQLIVDAWDDFVDRLRWSTFFRMQKDHDTEGALIDDYDPDYALPRRSTRTKAKKLDRVFEYGITQGTRMINTIVSNLPSKVMKGDAVPGSLLPPISVLRDYLINNELMLMITDKNLGCALAPRTWVIDQSVRLLASPADYTELKLEDGAIKDRARYSHYNTTDFTRGFYPGTPDVRGHIYAKEAHMEYIANYCEERDLHPQLPDFFRSYLIPEKTKKVAGSVLRDHDHHYEYLSSLPRFYVIPKIHKNPVKARPIVPCHSVIQGPAGKYVSKHLKPIVQSLPYILHGTKDLVLKLNKLNLPLSRVRHGRQERLFFVSGDVVAFYPNINRQKAHTIANDLYQKWLAHSDLSDDEIVSRSWLMRECLIAADEFLLMQFNGKYYIQNRGLAMGVACSPDLANVYGAYHEMGLKINEQPFIAFYGRYIDDVLALVYAPNEEHATMMMSSVEFENCEIEWSSSDKFINFLDLTLFFEDNRLKYKPFRKPMNHFERLPWISSHPEYVKRGTFVSELSRLATLSSEYDFFVDACREIAAIYIARGYPPLLISSWLKKNSRERWEARLNESVPTISDVLVLKSEYNISWDLFDVKKLEEQLKTGWMTALRAISFGHLDDSYSPELLATKLDLSLVRDSVSSLRTERLHWKTVEPDPSVMGSGSFGEFLRVDKLGLLGKKLIVSKRRTTQLLDLAAAWRRVVLENRDSGVIQPDWLEASSRQLRIDHWVVSRRRDGER